MTENITGVAYEFRNNGEGHGAPRDFVKITTYVDGTQKIEYLKPEDDTLWADEAVTGKRLGIIGGTLKFIENLNT